MSRFVYKGRGPGGSVVSGTLEAASTGAAVESLQKSGITPLKVMPGSNGAFDLNQFWQRIQERDPRPADLIMLTRQLYTLTRSGIPLATAISSLAGSSRNRRLADSLRDVGEGLRSGLNLSQALARNTGIFPPLYISMVRVGEDTGRLEEVFLQLANYLELDRATRDSIKTALRYPIIVLTTIGIAMALINVFVIPAFAKVFQGFNAELPLMTKILIGMSDFSVNYWPVIVGALVLTVLGMRSWLATRAGRYRWDRFKITIPLVGSIIERATLGRVCRSFALVLRSGVPFLQGLALVSHAAGNEFVTDKLLSMRSGIERGDSLTRTAASSELFTPLVLQMIAIGEETGRLDELLQEVAEYYEREVEAELKNLSSAIEPIMIAAIGGLVLVLALGVFLPMWDLGAAAGHSG